MRGINGLSSLLAGRRKRRRKKGAVFLSGSPIRPGLLPHHEGKRDTPRLFVSPSRGEKERDIFVHML